MLILKNVSGVVKTFDDIGRLIGVDRQYVVSQKEYDLFRQSVDVETEILNGSIQVGTGSQWLTDPDEALAHLKQRFDDDSMYIDQAGSRKVVHPFIVTDPSTGIRGPGLWINLQSILRELYNAADNPLYKAGFVPILGPTGWAEDHASRILNLETIHDPGGWHDDQVQAALWRRPPDMLFYYGWLNSFNSAQNGWSNENVAQDLAKYELVIVGDGIQDPSHGDYANTQVILPRVRALNPRTVVFGYIQTDLPFETVFSKIDQWVALGVNGIFFDRAGYDFGNDREGQNLRVRYAHDNGLTAFMNAWNMDHVIGTAEDASYPNATFNPLLKESELTRDDWYLLESFPVNTAAYASPGINPHTDWAARGVKAIGHRANYGIKISAVSVINNDNADGQKLFDFSAVSALMFSLDAHGSSDTNYGSGSATVKFWTRPGISGLGILYDRNPSVQSVIGDADKYLRYTQSGRLILDYGLGVNGASIEVQ